MRDYGSPILGEEMLRKRKRKERGKYARLRFQFLPWTWIFPSNIDCFEDEFDGNYAP
jgi:hypothetical protein